MEMICCTCTGPHPAMWCPLNRATIETAGIPWGNPLPDRPRPEYVHERRGFQARYESLPVVHAVLTAARRPVFSGERRAG